MPCLFVRDVATTAPSSDLSLHWSKSLQDPVVVITLRLRVDVHFAPSQSEQLKSILHSEIHHAASS